MPTALIVALVLSVLLAGILWYRRSEVSPSPTQATPALSPAVQTLAVLPFHDLSGEAGSQVWGIGIADAIISRLAALKNLAVRPTNSVLKYAKAPDDPAQAARELQVDSVLAGTYQRVGGLMRVSVQLVDNGVTRWANRYDLQGHDMLRFEDDVAQKVVQELSVHLSGSEQKALDTPATHSPEAYDALLQARAYLNDYFDTSRVNELQQARKMAELAIQKDAAFTDAYAMLAQIYGYEGANFSTNAARNIELGEQTAHKAVALNPQSFSANLALGWIYSEQGKNAEAIRILRKVIDLAPNSLPAWESLGYSYHYAGLVDLAEAAFRHSRDMNPAPARIYWMHARMLLYQGKPHEAEEEVRQALERHPDQFKLMSFLGDFLYYQDRFDEAERILRRALDLRGPSGDEEPEMMLAIVGAARGERDRIPPRILQYKPEDVVDGDSAEWIGAAYALLGDKAAALRWFRRTVQLGNHNYPWFQRDKNWDKLRSDPEFQRILEEVQGHWNEYKKLVGQEG
jgi:TolB-like protein/Flp pilus assembly protein TadD